MPATYRNATQAEIKIAETINYWSTPDRNQGQAVEVSYSAGPHMKRPYECDSGDGWRRTVDHSDGSVAYSVLVPAP